MFSGDSFSHDKALLGLLHQTPEREKGKVFEEGGSGLLSKGKAEGEQTTPLDKQARKKRWDYELMIHSLKVEVLTPAIMEVEKEREYHWVSFIFLGLCPTLGKNLTKFNLYIYDKVSITISFC